MYYNNNYYYGGYNNLPQMNFSRTYPRVVVYGQQYFTRRSTPLAVEILDVAGLPQKEENRRLQHLSGIVKQTIIPGDLGLEGSRAGYNISRYRKAWKSLPKDMSYEEKRKLTAPARKDAREAQDSYNEQLANAVVRVNTGRDIMKEKEDAALESEFKKAHPIRYRWNKLMGKPSGN